MDLFTYDKYDYFPQPALLFRPPVLAQTFHAVPHLNYRAGVELDCFDLDSLDYIASLIFIIALPMMVIIFYMGPVFVYGAWGLFFRRGDADQWLRLKLLLSFLATVLTICGLAIEFMLHSTVIEVTNSDEYNFYLTEFVFDLRNHTNKFRLTSMSDNDIYYTYIHFRGLYEKRYITNLLLYDHTLYPYYYLFGFFYREFNIKLSEIQLPKLNPQVVEMSLKRPLQEGEIQRRNVAVVIWLSGLLVPIMQAHRYWPVTMLGLVWSGSVTGLVAGAAVALADLCHDPEVIASKYSDKNVTALELDQRFQILCDEFNRKAFKAQQELPEPFIRFYPVLAELYKYCTTFCSSGLAGMLARFRDRMRDVLYYNQTTVFANLPLLNCSAMKKYKEDVPDDTLIPFCENDVILKWYFVELVLCSFVMMTYGYLFLLHINNVKNYKHYGVLNAWICVVSFMFEAFVKLLRIVPVWKFISRTIKECVACTIVTIKNALKFIIKAAGTIISQLCAALKKCIKKIIKLIIYGIKYTINNIRALFSKEFREKLMKAREKRKIRQAKRKAKAEARKLRLQKEKEAERLNKKKKKTTGDDDDYTVEPMVLVDIDNSTKILVPLNEIKPKKRPPCN